MPEYAIKISFEYVSEANSEEDAHKIGYQLIEHLKLEELKRCNAYVDDTNLLGENGFIKNPKRPLDDF